MKKICFADLNWNEMRQSAMKKSCCPKKSQDWDKKAPSFSCRTNHSYYTEKFIRMLKPAQDWSVLDAGCGPGTIALPLSSLVKQITAFDFSPKMLKILNHRAAEQNINNISTRLLSWDEDWRRQKIATHDIAIASRSLNVSNLKSILEKLTTHARKGVYITDRVGSGPHDPNAFRAIGRDLPQNPDYIYTVNLLYQMGHNAEVNFIRLEDTLSCKSSTEAVETYSWMFKNITQPEQKLLEKYVQSVTSRNNDGTYTVHRQHTPCWAFIHWPV